MAENGRPRKQSVTESIVFRSNATADIVRSGGGRGGGAARRKTNRSASMQMDFDEEGGYDAYGTDVSNAGDVSEGNDKSPISAPSQPLLPAPGSKPKPPPPPMAKKPAPPLPPAKDKPKPP
eukprot:CAMPEP_0171982176 /NCGR_PEP_ID=MMETSP0993-20121228/269885_1 /TAXON_ID=483369 /ORGANISM="non described non described, Strain CCMP2098" /LENGTH=120 /DNA_ID=CAMNT_0012634747 /DNA_START=35 /DNA_END=393 /DNA_ORIENTATION=+